MLGRRSFSCLSNSFKCKSPHCFPLVNLQTSCSNAKMKTYIVSSIKFPSLSYFKEENYAPNVNDIKGFESGRKCDFLVRFANRQLWKGKSVQPKACRRRMRDLGLVDVHLLKSCEKPSGDVAYEIRGAVIALRFEEASKVFVKPC